MRINATTVRVVQGNLLEMDVQAIVNAANEGMRGGGGIDGLIHRHAGPELLTELRLVAPHGTKTGQAVLTRGHNLRQQYVIHTPGPIWSEGRAETCAEELQCCYLSCLEIAEAQQIESIGFCAISTGIYSFPVQLAARLAIATVSEYLRLEAATSLRRVVFVTHGEDAYEAFSAALRQERANAWQQEDAHQFLTEALRPADGNIIGGERNDSERDGVPEFELTEEDEEILGRVWADVARENVAREEAARRHENGIDKDGIDKNG